MSAPLISGLGGDAGFGENSLGRNDDGSSLEIDLSSIFEGGLNFFGTTYTSLFVNNNGSVTFGQSRSAFTPDLIDANGIPEISPYFADVDTRGGIATATPGGNSTGSNLVYFDLDTANDRFVVTWDDVGYYNSNTNSLNAFQLILSDKGGGDFDIEFRYESVNWTTGDLSGGEGGLGGTVARAGYSAGTGEEGSYYELESSGDQAAMLALDTVAGNTGLSGRWIFTVRAGVPLENNHPPVAVDDSVLATEDTTANYQAAILLANDTDVDGDILSVAGVGNPVNGMVSQNGSTISFTPNADFVGTAGFDYTVSDGRGGTDIGHVTVTVQQEANVPPVAVDDTFDAPRNVSKNYLGSVLLANDTDANGDLLAITSADNPLNGSLSRIGSSIRFTPDTGFVGTAGFDYTISDGRGGTDVGHVTINVSGGPNAAPVLTGAQAILPNGLEDTPYELNAASLIQGFTDPDGDAISVSNLTATHATVQAGPGGQFTIVPDADYYGLVALSYNVVDSIGAGTPATQEITFDRVVMIPLGGEIGVLTVDGVFKGIASLPATVPKSISFSYSVTNPLHGTVKLGENGQFDYRPFENYEGPDSFVVTATGGGRTFTTTVKFEVVRPPAEPFAEDNDVIASEDVPADYSATVLLANDIKSGEDDELSLTDVFNSTNGTAILNGSTIRFTPDADFNGTAGFDYRVSNSSGVMDLGHVRVTVSPQNDDPTAPANRSISTGKGVTAGPIAIGAMDVDGDNLDYSVKAGSAPSLGIVSFSGNAFNYEPIANAIGTDNFTILIGDGSGGSAEQAVSVTIGPSAALKLLSPDGFAGEVGGSGQVVGSSGFQDIAILDVPGTISLDPSFNKGGDIVRLVGNAGDWQVAQAGSLAIFSDGDTFVQIPIGSAGLPILFDDGPRILRFDAGQAILKIGGQSFATQAVQITAPADNLTLPTGADPAATGRLFLGEGVQAIAGGNINVFGATGSEGVTITHGHVTFDPSFNKGGDTLILNQQAPDFLASQLGSSVVLNGSVADLLIPVGLAGTTLSFPGDDDRTLIFDPTLPAILIGTEGIDSIPTSLGAFG